MKDKMFEVMLAGFGLMLSLQLYTMTQVNDIDRRLSYLEGCWSTKMCRLDVTDVQVKKAE